MSRLSILSLVPTIHSGVTSHLPKQQRTLKIIPIISLNEEIKIEGSRHVLTVEVLAKIPLPPLVLNHSSVQRSRYSLNIA